MADTKLSALTAANSAGDEDYIYVVQSGASRRATVEMVRSPAAPFNTQRPLITPTSGGFAYDLGAWTNNPSSFAVQILRNGVEVAAGTGPGEYVFSGGPDDGATFIVLVDATNAVDTVNATSLPYAQAGLSAPSLLDAPTIEGASTRPINSDLSWTAGSWNPGIPEATLVRTVRANGVTIATDPVNPWPSAGRTAGEIITIHEQMTNTVASVSSTSNAVTLTAALSPNGTLVWPSGDLVAGGEYDCPFDLIEGSSVWWQAYNGETPVGSDAELTISNEPTVAVTPNAAGSWTLRLFDADGGNLIYTSPARTVLAATEAITISTTLAATYTPSAVVALSGTYAGAWSGTGTIQVYDALDAPVGSATNITNVANGTWGPTKITLPSDADTGYYVKAIHADAVTEVDSTAFEITASAAAEVAEFTFEGTGSGADSITLFGHAFPEGAIPTTAGVPDDDIVLRNTNGSTLYRTQFNVLSLWDDDSVKTALIAGEMPDLADTVTMTAKLLYGAAHGDPGTDLDFTTELTGRSVAIKTWAPGNTTTPLWTYDPIADIGADRWHEGPLALSTRVETAVPSSAVQNTSGATGTIDSVRLIVDIIVTKDDFLEVDVCFSNDRVMSLNGGIARFGYTIEIDGVMVYDQRPSSGAAIDLLQYSQWMRRRGRKADGTLLTGVGTSNRPFARPDHDVLVTAGVLTAYDRSQVIEPINVNAVRDKLTEGEARLDDPYWNWGFNRSAGAVGGRQEIGYRTFANAMWLRDGERDMITLSHRQLEAYATTWLHFWDWDLGRWLNPVDWPLMSYTSHTSSAAGTSRTTATGLPTNQRPTHNDTDHLTIDEAHHPSCAWTVALCSGRRHAYDQMAARAAWAATYAQDRFSGSVLNHTNWRNATQALETGIAWAPRPWFSQTRAYAWSLRCVVDAAVILPDAYPNRTVFTQTCEAWINAWNHALPELKAQFGDDIGLPILYPGLNVMPNYMFSFLLTYLPVLYKTGVGGANTQTVAHEWIKLRVNNILDGGFPFRNVIAGNDIYPRYIAGGTFAQTWADVWANTTDPNVTTPNTPRVEVPADWGSGTRGEGDYHKNTLSTLGAMYGMDLPKDLHAKVADALVLVRSERQNNDSDPLPRLLPLHLFGIFFQTNSLTSLGVNYQWDTAPVVVPGQSFEIEGDAAPGSVVGVVRFTGCVPRNSHYGTTPSALAWEITDQPVGDPFEISMGGALKLAGNPPAAGTVNVTVRPRTYTLGRSSDSDPSGTELLGTAATVSVTTTAVAAEILSVTPASPQQVLAGAEIGTVVYTVTVRGNAPITPSITSGNDTLFEFVYSGSGNIYQVKVADTLSADTYPLTLQVSNAHGNDTANVSIEVVSDADAPVIGASQTFEFNETLDTAVAADPATVTYTGDVPTVAEFTAGNTGSRLAVTLDGSDVELTNAAALRRTDLAQLTPTLRLANAGGEDSKTITVNIVQPWALKDTAPSAVYLYAWSIARRIVDSYTGPLIRIRRSSDNAEQDIGFTASGGYQVLDESAITTFVGANNWWIHTIYDQSLQGIDLIQATTGSQPVGGTSGGFNRVGTNNRAGANFNNKAINRTGLDVPLLTSPLFQYVAAQTTGISASVHQTATSLPSTNNPFQIRLFGSAARFVGGNAQHDHATGVTNNAPYMAFARWLMSGSDRIRGGFNAESVTGTSGGNSSVVTTNQTFQVGSTSASFTWKGNIAEVVLGRDISTGTHETEVLDELAIFFGV